MNTPTAEFEIWWRTVGSGITPIVGADHEEHAHRLAKLSWSAHADLIRALVAELQGWIDDCYCQHDSLKHPDGCGHCEDSRAAVTACNKIMEVKS